MCASTAVTRPQKAALIVVVRGGIATQTGTFSSLADQPGYFKTFVERSVAGGADDAAELATQSPALPLAFESLLLAARGDVESTSMVHRLRERILSSKLSIA